jgi:hypothetical protein
MLSSQSLSRVAQRWIVYSLSQSRVLSDHAERYVQLVTVADDDAKWVTPQDEVTNILAESFARIPQVKSICAQFNGEIITIWTLLESYNREARNRVYEKELEICERLRFYDFDFRATSIELVSPDELKKAGSVEIFKRA